MKKRPVNDQGKLVLDLPEDDWRMQLFASFNESLEMCGGLRLADAESADPQGAVEAGRFVCRWERRHSKRLHGVDFVLQGVPVIGRNALGMPCGASCGRLLAQGRFGYVGGGSPACARAVYEG